MIVVLDANVFVSAAIARGASNRIVDAWLSGSAAFEIVLCPELLGEIVDVLTTRPRLRKWIAIEDAQVYVETIRSLANLVSDPDTVAAATRDSGDDYLVALAREHQADVIVSGDKDLLEWAEQDPPVVTPADFERRVSL